MKLRQLLGVVLLAGVSFFAGSNPEVPALLAQPLPVGLLALATPLLLVGGGLAWQRRKAARAAAHAARPPATVPPPRRPSWTLGATTW